MTVKTIVLTGGPCAGKTESILALKMEYPNELVIVPEAATMLFQAGFPQPVRDLEWSEEWQERFQRVIISLQKELEDTFKMMAKQSKAKAIVCDRGIFDNAAYCSGGVNELVDRYDVSFDDFSRYDLVIHLESMATSSPEKYSNRGNACRWELVDEAKQKEEQIREAWKDHPNRVMILGYKKLGNKIQIIDEHVQKFIE